MKFPNRAIKDIQAAGAAVYKADQTLKKAVDEIAASVREAVAKGVLDNATEQLFGKWRALANVSKVMGTIEADLKSVYTLVAAQDGQITAKDSQSHSLASDSLPLPSTLSPEASGSKVKKGQKKAATQAVTQLAVPAETIAKAKPVKSKALGTKPKAKKSPAAGATITGNAQKVVDHLRAELTGEEFKKLSMAATNKVVGLPLGSIGASFQKLLRMGVLEKNEQGEFRFAPGFLAKGLPPVAA
jgi:hypothetical protein